jgi:hypothetical protein
MARITPPIINIGLTLWMVVVVLSFAACAATNSGPTTPPEYRGQIWELALTGEIDATFLLAAASIPGQNAELVNGTLESNITLPEYGQGRARIRVKGQLDNGTLKATIEGLADFGTEKAPLWGELTGQCLGPRCSGTYGIKYDQGEFQGTWKGQVYDKQPQIRTWSFGSGDAKPAGNSDAKPAKTE